MPSNTGWHHSQETIEKIRAAHIGKSLSPEHRAKIGRSGDKSPHFGKHPSLESLKKMSVAQNIRFSDLNNCPMYGKTHSEKSIEKMRGSHKGQISSMKGKHHTEETKRKISKSGKGKIRSSEFREKVSESRKGHPTSLETRIKISNAHKGKTLSIEHRKKLSASRKIYVAKPENRKKISESLKGVQAGEKNPAWKGGTSFEPYCPKFNNGFKERVRKRQNYTCQLCGRVWQHGERKLAVHHVNYNKMVCCNNVKPLFVALCCGCNSKVNANREFYEELFTNLILLEYDGESYLPK